MSDSAPEARPSSPSLGRGRLLRILDPALWIAVLALAFAGWQWYEGLGEATQLRKETAAKLAAAGAEARLAAEQAREAVAAAQARLATLESRLAGSESQKAALEALGQELARNRDDWAYAEIEQSLFIASQQLSLAGNVKAAFTALQTADARLQRMDRPQLAPLRKAIHRDIERLKAAPHVDTLAISTRLDVLIAQVDKLPLAMEARAHPEPQPAAPGEPGAAEPGAWARFWNDVWAELAQLVRVQRMDPPDAVLLAPSHAFFLRENLKLRLIGARLALLSRDTASYKADLKAARDWLNRYFSARDNNVAHALATLRNLHDAAVGIDAPEIGATLEAMRNLRAARERGRQ